MTKDQKKIIEEILNLIEADALEEAVEIIRKKAERAFHKYFKARQKRKIMEAVRYMEEYEMLSKKEYELLKKINKLRGYST